MLSNFGGALLLDAIVVSLCCVILVRFARLTFFHPAVMYIGFHLYTVTSRLLALFLGAPTMRTQWGFVDPDEIIRAALGCDLALIVVTIVWLVVTPRRQSEMQYSRPRTIRVLLPRPTRVIAWIAIAIGCFALRYLVFSNSYDIARRHEDLGIWSASTWVTMTVTWVLQGLVLLHYVDGFRPIHTAITTILLGATILASGRSPIIIWGIFLVLVYLLHKRLEWPTKWMWAMLLVFVVIWYPLKIIRNSINSGESISAAGQEAVDYTENSFRESSGDTVFLDQMAVMMTQVDRYGSYFYGSTVLPLLYTPIPRPWWPDKPALNEYQYLLSTADRPMAQNGQIATLGGEGYANFGWFGLLLYPALMAFAYGKLCAKVQDYPKRSILLFFYIVSLPTVIMILRDGLIPLITAIAVGAMPMMLVILAHLGIPNLERKVYIIPNRGRVRA